MTLSQQWKELAQVWAGFSGTTLYSFQVGPFCISLHFALPSLEKKLTKAFDHLKRESPLSSDLTIYLWDTAQQGKLPNLNWNAIQSNGYRGYWEPPFYFHYFESIHALSILNTEENKGYYIVRDTEKLPWWVSGSPLQVLLHTWFQEKKMQLTHSAAISSGKKGLLLAGKGGSGKSTTVLACLTEGLHYIAEDYSLLSAGEVPQVWSIYQSAKWRPPTRHLFPDYERFIANADIANREKALVYYRDIFPEQLALSSPIQGVLSLEVGTEKMPVLKTSDFTSTLKNLLMSTLFQLPFHHNKTLPLLKEAVAHAHHHHLVLGQDIQANTELIRELL